MNRNATIDYARLIAAFGIVLFHAKTEGGAIGYAGLPFFTMLTVCLAIQTAQGTTFKKFLSARIHRLLRPWLVWSAIYGALKIAQVIFAGADIHREFSWWMLLTGPAIHLWFLPFIFVISVMIFPIGRRMRSRSFPITAIMATTATSTLLAFAWLSHSSPHIPFSQWLAVLPAALWGIGLSFIWQRSEPILLSGGLMLLFVIIAAKLLGWTTDLLQFGIAATGMMLCILLPLRETSFSRLAAQTSLFVYLAHPLVLTLLHQLAGLRTRDLSTALLACLLTFALSAGMEILKRPMRLSPPH